MIKSKAWVKDRCFEYRPGDIVRLVRKKENGHPRALSFGICYKILKVENEDLFVQGLDDQELRITKVNKNYFAPIQKMRDEMINDILSND